MTVYDDFIGRRGEVSPFLIEVSFNKWMIAVEIRLFRCKFYFSPSIYYSIISRENYNTSKINSMRVMKAEITVTFGKFVNHILI